MSIDDSFLPVEPVSPLAIPPVVVPRGRRHFGQRSRELYNQVNQIQKELTDPAPPILPRDTNPFPIPENHPRIDKLV